MVFIKSKMQSVAGPWFLASDFFLVKKGCSWYTAAAIAFLCASTSSGEIVTLSGHKTWKLRGFIPDIDLDQQLIGNELQPHCILMTKFLG